MYFHNRNTGDDFYEIVEKNRKKFKKGVVHSFTGTAEEIKRILDLDLHISINGLAFKKQRNLDLLKLIPLNKLMIETDAPYCQIKKWFKGNDLVKTRHVTKSNPVEKFVKGEMVYDRNEPCNVI